MFQVGIPALGFRFLAFRCLGNLQVTGGEAKHQLSFAGIDDTRLRGPGSFRLFGW